ncbi:MAG: hypothetical protein JOZ72_07870 [Alphaproteobacteria bacterium]|nr:hypothetical protein [Alphaproteobacteria bacterium]
MLVICYGMAKSGSTLAYELVRGVLGSAGHSQARIKSKALRKRDDGNYLATVAREALEDAMAKIGSERIVAAKTHKVFTDDMFPWIEEMQAARKLQVIASYRDPRDICLSLVDHGQRSRAKGDGSYAHVGDLERAMHLVEKAIPKFRQWGAVEGTLRMFYETVAFAPDAAIDAIEAVLGVKGDREAAKKHAFEDAFTQLNKARKNRYEDELDDAQKAMMLDAFGVFIEKVCGRNDQEWFSRHRRRVMRRLAAESAAGDGTANGDGAAGGG